MTARRPIPPEMIESRIAAIWETLQRSEGNVLACLNVDVTYLPVTVHGVPLPEPSIDHSIVKCHACGDDVWIGPMQRTRVGARLCYICTMIMITRLKVTPDVVAINPDEAKIPRRRTR